MKRGILGTIGSPLVQVRSPSGSTVAAKVESFNPGGSAKDRPAVAMVEAAERDGHLEPGDRLIEPTSGNTGIGLSMVGAARGYDVTLVMPASKSPERRGIMRAYGAEIELVEGDISDARARADEIEREEGGVQVGQFENAANPESHYRTTGREILDQVGGRTIDAFVAGVGTGGTVTGVGRRLRESVPDVRIVAVEPEANAVLSGEDPGEDEFQGMGPGFVSPNLDVDFLDEVRTVSLDRAEEECRRLAREEGILVGQSSGAACVASRRVARDIAHPELDCPEPSNETNILADGGEYEDCPLVVTVFPDSGERYLSTGLFD